jgi:putative ABC transport system substrate-binding protein
MRSEVRSLPGRWLKPLRYLSLKLGETALRRRAFIKVLGGTIAAWPLAAHGQQPGERVPRIGVILPATPDDAQNQAWLEAFLQGLGQSGWIIGRNIKVDTRWATANVDAVSKQAAELAAVRPDAILAAGASTMGPLLKATRTVPIVFAAVADPVGAGFVESLARPGGNATGFMAFEYSISGKWLELLKQIAPGMARVAVLRDPNNFTGLAQFGVIQAMAPALRVEVNPVSLRDVGEIERAITSFARSSGGGLIIAASGLAYIRLNVIMKLAAQYRLPAVYFDRAFVAAGGLMSYGPILPDQFTRAAQYVDRILKGEKPGDLPVQAPTKYELAINLKTAKVLGLTVPGTLLAQANQVIE